MLRSSNDAERQYALGNMLRGIDIANRLLEKLLTLARVDPETAAAQFEPLQLRDLVSTVILIWDHWPISNRLN